MNKQQIGMENEEVFSKASATWKELQAIELWQWSGSQEPAGYSDLSDIFLHPLICWAISREEDCIVLSAWWWHWPMQLSDISSPRLCKTHMAFAGVKICQPNGSMAWFHQEQEQFPPPCICCHLLSTLPPPPFLLRTKSTKIPGAKRKEDR